MSMRCQLLRQEYFSHVQVRCLLFYSLHVIVYIAKLCVVSLSVSTVCLSHIADTIRIYDTIQEH